MTVIMFICPPSMVTALLLLSLLLSLLRYILSLSLSILFCFFLICFLCFRSSLCSALSLCSHIHLSVFLFFWVLSLCLLFCSSLFLSFLCSSWEPMASKDFYIKYITIIFTKFWSFPFSLLNNYLFLLFFVFLKRIDIHTHAYINTHTQCMHCFTSIYIYIHTYVRTYIHTTLHIHNACIMHMHMHMHCFTYIYTYIHTYIHTLMIHTYTYTMHA